jgi:hypothetical protein
MNIGESERVEKKSSYEMPEQSVGQVMIPKLISGWLDAVVAN